MRGAGRAAVGRRAGRPTPRRDRSRALGSAGRAGRRRLRHGRGRLEPATSPPSAPARSAPAVDKRRPAAPRRTSSPSTCALEPHPGPARRRPSSRAMKPTALLVNTCRGPIVDERPLSHALTEGRIARRRPRRVRPGAAAGRRPASSRTAHVLPRRTSATSPTTLRACSSARPSRTSRPSPPASRCGCWPDSTGCPDRRTLVGWPRPTPTASWARPPGRGCSARYAGDDGPWLPETVPEDDAPVAPGEDRDSFYIGIGGLAPALAEIRQHRALTNEELALEHGIVERLLGQAALRTVPSLYDGLAGDAAALRLLDPGCETVALAAVGGADDPGRVEHPRPDRRRDRGAGERPGRRHRGHRAGRGLGGRPGGPGPSPPPEVRRSWGSRTPTDAGLDWPMVRDWPSRMPNYSHGTAGVATALAIAGQAPQPTGLRRRRGAGRPAPARRGLAGRGRIHGAAHDPAVPPVTWSR